MPCPDEETLSAWHDEALDAGPVAEHLKACPACRSVVEGFRSLDARIARAGDEERRKPVWRWAAAAAALLLAVAVWRPKPPVVPSPPSSPVLETRILGREGRYRFVPPGITLRLSEDAVMERREGRLELLAGSAAVSTDAGPVDLGVARLESGLLVLAWETERTSLLCREALAGGPSLKVVLVEGAASLRAADGRLSPLKPAGKEEAERLRTFWSSIPESGWRSGPLPEGRYVLEARLVPESMPQDGDLGVAYRVGDRQSVWWLRGGFTRQALGADPLSGEVRVRIVVDREVAVFVNGKACGHIPLDTVKDDGGGAPVRALRGKSRTELLRWRSLE